MSFLAVWRPSRRSSSSGAPVPSTAPPVVWVRAGTDVALHIDVAAVQVSVRDRAAGETMKKLKVRGREFKLDTDDGAPPGS